MSDLSVDVGTALPYIVDSVLGWFGQDAASKQRKAQVEKLARLSAQQASFVQCVGMATPIPIADIYQQTTLDFPEQKTTSAFPEPRQSKSSIEEVLGDGTDLVVFAGPGWGKTTLLHWLFVKLASKESETIPFLFTLRWPGCTDDLEDFITQLVRPSRHHAKRLLLLVDGYDEIPEDDRRRVSKALLEFKSLGIGNYLLSCRSYYDVYDLKAVHCRIEPFSDSDSLQFIRSFSRIYNARIDAPALMDELATHGLSDFVSHPLMLTLVCMLKTSANPEIPRRAIGLVRRAIDTLTLRWDEQKGVRRVSEIAIDGEERVRCLMYIAFNMNELVAAAHDIESYARGHLRLVQVKGIDTRRLLDELARWYGVLIPVEADKWQFVHRTIHDYLAARYWVESGGFAGAEVSSWNSRAAFATCLLPDGTSNICRMLRDSGDLSAFVECLYNGALFDASAVAAALVTRAVRLRGLFKSTRLPGNLVIESREDFFSLVGDELLEHLIKEGCARGQTSGDFVAFYALSEVKRRRLRVVTEDLLHCIELLDRRYEGSPLMVMRGAQQHLFRAADVLESGPAGFDRDLE